MGKDLKGNELGRGLTQRPDGRIRKPAVNKEISNAYDNKKSKVSYEYGLF